MIDWLASIILVGVLFLAGRMFYSLYKNNPKRKYKSIRAGSKKDATYYPTKREKSRDFSPEQKSKIYARDKGQCQICKAKGRDSQTKNAPKGFKQQLVYWLSHVPGLGFLWLNLLAEIDHIILNAWNGPAELWNGRVAHRVCNRKRPWREPDEDFLKLCQERNEKVYF